MCGLLVRRLRARRNRGSRPAEPWARGAIANREDVVITRRLKGRAHDELVDAVGFEAIEIAQEIRRLDAGGPHYKLGRNHLSGRELHAARHHFGDSRGSANADIEAIEHPVGGSGYARRQRGQDAIRSLDQDEQLELMDRAIERAPLAHPVPLCYHEVTP